MTADLAWMPATELARLMRAKALSPVEVAEATLARIERLNPRLNAFCTLVPESALAAARAAEGAVMRGTPGPLCGVPFSIKDLSWTAGVRTMAGSYIFEHRVPAFDAPVVERLKAAGGVMLGKTTTPEFGWKGLGDSPLTGITRNPWNPGMTTGGSSAGAGAAAAAGLGPLHQGSDGAGSIRIPSAFCGVYGLKPSFGRVPYWPTPNNDNASHIGPMTRTVADAALMLSVMAGPDDRDRTTLDGAPADYVGRLHEGVRGLRAAWSPTLGGLRVDREVAVLAARAARAFEELGCAVEEVEPAWPDTTTLIRALWSAHEAGALAAHLGRWRERMDPGLVACIEDGRRYSAVDYVELRGRKMEFWDSVRAFFETYDLLLTPSLSVAAFPVGRLNPEGWPQHAWDWIGWAS
ncbi:MAG TPA: amidase family protein, partial [Candidatus Tectomicrobia bacterium]|nr:amidase family protein [Candidatus Tectomicrobia bacterium]